MDEEHWTDDSREMTDEEYRAWMKECNRRIIKIGCLTDLLVAPAISMIIEESFGHRRTLRFAVMRYVPRFGNLQDLRYFDIFAYSETHFFLVECRETARMPDAEAFVALLPALREYFPEIDRRELVPIFAAIDVGDQLLDYLTEHGVYCMDIDTDEDIAGTRLTNFDAVQAARPGR